MNEVPISGYDKYKNIVHKDIETINRSTRKVQSSDVITLKQAYEVNKFYKTYKSTFQKIIDGDYDIIQNIAFEVVRFAFSRYYTNKPYLSDMTQQLQYYILKLGVIGLRGSNNSFAADCLEHSLQESPEDIIVTEGKIIDNIQDDNNFKEVIKNIFEEKDESYIEAKRNLSFVNGDLFYALHGTTMNVEGKKKNNNKWDLEIEITDRYDFTDLREIEQYIINDNSYATGLIGAFANNLGMIASSCKVIHEYNITIKFSIKGWEV